MAFDIVTGNQHLFELADSQANLSLVYALPVLRDLQLDGKRPDRVPL